MFTNQNCVAYNIFNVRKCHVIPINHAYCHYVCDCECNPGQPQLTGAHVHIMNDYDPIVYSLHTSSTCGKRYAAGYTCI